MKIYTKAGDKGKTFMPGEGKVDKYDCSVDAQGEIDELNAWLAHLLQEHPESPEEQIIVNAQNVLMHIGAQLATREQRLRESDITELEISIDRMEGGLPELTNFILPCYPTEGHIARTVCRRAERQMAAWEANADDKEKFNLILPYLNRLSDFLFVWCRTLCGNLEEVWYGNDR